MDRDLKLTMILILGFVPKVVLFRIFWEGSNRINGLIVLPFYFFNKFFISLILIWSTVDLSGWFVHVSFSLKEVTLLPGLKFAFLFSLVSQRFWWWLHWRSLQAQAALWFLPFIKVAQKYLAFLTGFVCFQMGIPFFLEKH